MVSFRCRYGFVSLSLWFRFVIAMVSFRFRYGFVSLSLWFRFVIAMVSFRYRYGFVSLSLWFRFVFDMVSFRCFDDINREKERILLLYCSHVILFFQKTLQLFMGVKGTSRR